MYIKLLTMDSSQKNTISTEDYRNAFLNPLKNWNIINIIIMYYVHIINIKYVIMYYVYIINIKYQ